MADSEDGGRLNTLTKVGLGITTVWLIAFAIVLFNKWAAAEAMGLNEWGDFLAGLTAPLALIWIVIGYFLQGKELKLNTEALKAQQEELRRQVEETALLAKNSNRQAKAAEKAVEILTQERAAHDHEDRLRRQLRIKTAEGINSSHGISRTVFENIGDSVSHVSVSEAPSDVRINRGAMIHTSDKIKFTWPAGTPLPLRFALDYSDSAGRRRRAHFEITDKAELVALGESEVPTQ